MSVPGVDPARLTLWQLKGIACARCGRELRPPAVSDIRYLGTIRDCLDRPVPLWARAPGCRGTSCA
ncbi:hypothetical protein [Streptomyces sp. B6B3]|uniref:hypothetical protein n=1 Tax=Streptomyces sp. B6B3 TaxID=3153570 RepID=UPI00325C837F